MVEEKPVLVHGGVESLFAGMAEWRVADIVRQSKRFHQVHIQAKLGGDGAGDLGDFDGVREAIAEVVGVTAGGDMGLRFQAAKSPREDNPVTVTLEVVSIRMLGLGITASARCLYPHGVVGEHEGSLAFLIFAC